MIWQRLYGYCAPWLLQGAACGAYVRGLQRVGYDPNEPPDIAELTARVQRDTGWTLVPADGEVPMDAFFAMLAARAFPVVPRMRPMEQLFAALEPDLWHEAMGHVPLLYDAPVSALYQSMGRAGVVAGNRSPSVVAAVTNLYWFCGEYGLIEEGGQARLFGAALLAAPMTRARLVRQALGVERWRCRAVTHAPYMPHRLQRRLFCMASLDEVHADLRGILTGGPREKRRHRGLFTPFGWQPMH